MAFTAALQALQDLPFALVIAENAWLFPTIETFHVLALAIVVGSISMIDLRLLGIAHRKHAVTHLSHDVLPWTWAGFVVAVASGALMFSAKAVDYWDNPFFRIKLGLLLAAGINMAIFHLFTWRSVADWDQTASAPRAARIAGLVSLLFWIGVVICGRWIGFA